MNNREHSEQLLAQYMETENLLKHSRMVAHAMESYARELDKPAEEIEKWWTAGLLHDLDWEKYPDEHPNKAIKEILPEAGYPEEVIEAVRAHAPERTEKDPETEIERYLYACDELSGFMNAVALMRPNGFADMKVKSVKKKLKDKSFAEAVPRDQIWNGAELIGKDLGEHIQFMIDAFKEFEKKQG